MTHKEQEEFVFGFCNNIRNSVIQNINRHPEEWNGLELRQLLANKFADAAYVKMDRKRKRAFNNEVLVRNL